MLVRSTVRRSVDFERISNLPRRRWTAEQMDSCAAWYTSKLRNPGGTMSLRPLQAVALHETASVGGLLGPLRVGAGKTLYSLLAPKVLNAVRPVLLLPAALIEKTKRELGLLMVHWAIPRNIQLQSYEMLSRVSAARFLEIARPDVIIADEAHRLKNHRAGVTRRVARYMHDNPQTRFVAISGTLIKDDISNFAHLARWALKSSAPVPLDEGELMEWSQCLGKQSNPLVQLNPGPLLHLAAPEDIGPADDALDVARKGFRRRLLDTPGVVSSGNEQVSCSLYVRAVDYSVNDATESNFRKLRADWETPDGWALSQAVDIWRHARELALGFHYVWDPRPPEEWLNARRTWAAFVREVIGSSKSLDTELQVSQAHSTAPEWRVWERVRPTFQIQPKAIWHDNSALELCGKWALKDPGIVWVEHAFFGHELSRLTGLQYYGEQGLNASGQPIERADPRQSVIASARANSTGRNLQAWYRNLITSPPAGAPSWEQMIGRTHRDGQAADAVEVDTLLGCREHWEALERATEAARMTELTIGHSQKLLLADVAGWPSEGEIRLRARRSERWTRSENSG